MTIKLQNTAIINAEGNKTNRNCRAVFCITTNTFYASVAEAAKAIGVTAGAISWVLTKRMKTVKGLRFCYVHEIMEYMEEIAETNRANAEKARAYDEAIAKQNQIDKLNKRISNHEVKIAELRATLDREMELLHKAQEQLNNLK